MVGLELGLHTPVGECNFLHFFWTEALGMRKADVASWLLALKGFIVRFWDCSALGHLEIHHDWHQVSTNQLYISPEDGVFYAGIDLWLIWKSDPHTSDLNQGAKCGSTGGARFRVEI